MQKSISYLVVIGLLLPALASADLVLDLTDGRSIVVPVEKSEIKGLRFSEGKTRQPTQRGEDRTAGPKERPGSMGQRVCGESR